MLFDALSFQVFEVEGGKWANVFILALTLRSSWIQGWPLAPDSLSFHWLNVVWMWDECEKEGGSEKDWMKERMARTPLFHTHIICARRKGGSRPVV